MRSRDEILDELTEVNRVVSDLSRIEFVEASPYLAQVSLLKKLKRQRKLLILELRVRTAMVRPPRFWKLYFHVFKFLRLDKLT